VGEGVQGFSGGRSTGIGLDGLQAVVPLAGTQVNRLVVVPCQKKAKKMKWQTKKIDFPNGGWLRTTLYNLNTIYI